ncbi:hypothetical protein [Streptomyces acidiscabies]|uniref:hypothetical protein n=1 Tax=Streptomyces acidiscabies TaxID=42234 RepID=UPI0038F606C8
MSALVRRRYVTNTALYWFPVGLGVAPLVLLLGERGLAPATVAALISAHSFTAAALELPTGGLSDVLGRRGVLAAAGVLMCAAFLLIGLGGTAVPLGVGTGLLGAARALSSGPAEAWYVDSVRTSEGPAADLRTGLARGATASSVALAVGTVAGGALPWAFGGYGDELRRATGGAVLPLSTPMLLAALFALALTAHSLIALHEPPRPWEAHGGTRRELPPVGLGGIRQEPLGVDFGEAPGELPRPQAHLGDARPESPGADFGAVPGESPPPRSRLGAARRELPPVGLGGIRHEPSGAGFGSVPGELPRPQAHLGDARREPPPVGLGGTRREPSGVDFGEAPGKPPRAQAHLAGTLPESRGVDFGDVPSEPPRPQAHLAGTHPEPPDADLGYTPSEPPRPQASRREPPRPRPTLAGVLRTVPSTVLDGLRLAVRDAVVRRVMLSAAAAGSALAVVELLTPGWVAVFAGSAEGGAVGYAGLATVGFLCSALGSQVAPLLWGGRRAVVVGTGVVAGALVLLALGGDLAAVAGYAVFYVTLGVLGPNLNELLHHRVPDDRRATALSVQSLALQLAAGATGLIIGPLATDGALPWLFPLGVVLAVTLLWARPLRKVTTGQPVSPGGQEPRAVDLS